MEVSERKHGCQLGLAGSFTQYTTLHSETGNRGEVCNNYRAESIECDIFKL